MTQRKHTVMPGVYRIRCTVSNKVYIGSSINVWFRWSQHLHELKEKTHYNKRLQYAWNTHGSECFEFDVLEVVEKDRLLVREEYWIAIFDACNHAFGYNHIPQPTVGTRGLCGMWKHTLETRTRMSVMRIGKTLPPRSIEARRNMSLAHKGKRCGPRPPSVGRNISKAKKGKKFTEAHCRAMSLARLGKVQSAESNMKRSQTIRETLRRKRELACGASQ